MKIDGKPYRSIWREPSGEVRIIDQRWLPHELRIVPLATRQDFADAIRDMWVRGAPLIGATAAYEAIMNQRVQVLRETEPLDVEHRPRLVDAVDACRRKVLRRYRIGHRSDRSQHDRTDAARNERPELGTQQAEAEETQQRQDQDEYRIFHLLFSV